MGMEKADGGTSYRRTKKKDGNSVIARLSFQYRFKYDGEALLIAMTSNSENKLPKTIVVVITTTEEKSS